VTFNTRLLRFLDDVCAFLDGSVSVGFVAPAGDERRLWSAETLLQFRCFALSRRAQGVVRALVLRVAGFSGRDFWPPTCRPQAAGGTIGSLVSRTLLPISPATLSRPPSCAIRIGLMLGKERRSTRSCRSDLCARIANAAHSQHHRVPRAILAHLLRHGALDPPAGHGWSRHADPVARRFRIASRESPFHRVKLAPNPPQKIASPPSVQMSAQLPIVNSAPG